MESIKIGTNLPKEKISEIILSYPFNNKVNVQCDTFENREVFSFKSNKQYIEEVLIYNNLADLVQNIINRLYLKDLIRIRVSHILRDFIDEDIIEVENTVYDLLLDDNYFEKEKEIINNELKEYLIENNTIIIDGYLRFRSKSFEELIDTVIAKVITDIQMESEYEEFISLLQYYLDTQLPKVNTVNVIIKNDEYFLLDNNNNPIKSSSINSIIKEYDIDDISKADVLVSSLIVLAPNKVVIHIKNDKEKELMLILKKIFSHRISFCYSCNLCDVHISNNNDNND